jgi:hypothetical protein
MAGNLVKLGLCLHHNEQDDINLPVIIIAMDNQIGSSFTTSLPIVVFRYEPGQNPAEWREIDNGPGFIHLPPGEQVVIRARNIDDAELKILVREIFPCKAVTYMNLSENRNISDEGMRALAVMTHITGLNLSSCTLNDLGISRLIALTRLEHLNLSFCNRITDVSLRHLRKLTRLTYLDLQGCVKVSQRTVAMLERKTLTINR